MEELKYPIKFAIQKVEQPNFYTGKLQKGFIASKVYLVGEKNIYYKDGTIKKEYEIVYPFENIIYPYNEVLYKLLPKYNNETKRYDNSVIINKVFDTFEEARLEAIQLNNLSLPPFGAQDLNELQKTEEIVLSLTEDMKVETSVDVYKELLDLENTSTERACNTLKKHIK